MLSSVATYCDHNMAILERPCFCISVFNALICSDLYRNHSENIAIFFLCILFV